MRHTRTIKIAYIGGGSQNWGPSLIRDIIFRKGMEDAKLDIRLLDVHMGRAQAVQDLFKVKLKEWDIDRVKITATLDAKEAITGADFVLITISTGRLEAMANDLAIPEKYGVYHTVGDTCGPGGWSRTLRNIPVFQAYAEMIKKLAPNAFVLNYTNPMGTLTKVMADALGPNRVVGLCHGLFECYAVLQQIFGLESEKEILVRFSGMNHFFWIQDMKINGRDGHKMLRDKMKGGKSFCDLVAESHVDSMGFSSNYLLAGELLDNYGYLPYVGDRHTAEFFGCYITNPKLMERFNIQRTTVEQRAQWNKGAEDCVQDQIHGRENEYALKTEPSRETAADIIKAITFNEPFADVVNTVNAGQAPNLPLGAVVETMGLIDSSGFRPLAAGPLPESIRAIEAPHANVQIRTVEAAISKNKDDALMALAADPACAHLTISDIKKMGLELMEANKKYMPKEKKG
jgi:alpha-galactosidase/6-phospho-beta-glucosidase family protein